DFCRLALDYLKKGPNLKLYSAAAQKLQVEVNVIQLAVEGLVYLIVKSRQHNLSKTDFRELILSSGFTEEQEAALNELHDSNEVDIDSALSYLAPSLMHYHDLEWRFDVQVASRSLIRQTIPKVTLKLTLQESPQAEEEVKYKCLLLETDPNNLKHLIQKLDEALVEMSSQHSRRLQRIFK
ncbi:COMM domain-containing protein 2, partial [Frankliniella fusca]